MKAMLLLTAGLVGAIVFHVAAAGPAAGASPFRPDDVIALIGGEDMVALAESGRLEAQLVRQPGLAGVKVRTLAYEGDTVFEQHRQLNFPTWEEQLQKIGATVVIVQFGQMETLREDVSVDEFIATYEKLLSRLVGTNRQCVILSPTPFEKPAPPLPDRTAFNARIEEQLPRLHAGFVDLYRALPVDEPLTRDGIHLHEAGLRAAALAITKQLSLRPLREDDPVLLGLLAEKNRLWFNYHRPQNWAFLHGDRTEQLFSRDHQNPQIRRLLLEMEEYLPLIEAKEQEIITHLRGVQVERN
jgi:hypothetical protein